MKKLTAIVLSFLMCISVLSYYPMEGYAAEAKSAFGETSGPAGQEIKEWIYKANENSISAGWWHFKGFDTNWKSLDMLPDYASDLPWGEISYTVELWVKSGESYRKLGTADGGAGIEAIIDFHMEEGADYYINMSGVDGCASGMNVDWPLNWIDRHQNEVKEPKDAPVLDASTPRTVICNSEDDAKLLKFVAPEDGKYKFTYKDDKNVAAICLTQVDSDGYLYNSNWPRELIRDGVSYYKMYEGKTYYLTCSSFSGATEYTVSVKKVEEQETVQNRDYARALRKRTKAYSIAEAQAKGGIRYLNDMYLDRNMGLRVEHAEADDIAAFKKMAGRITKGCTTDKQKVDALAKWVKNNIKYDTGVTSYSSGVLLGRAGDCLGMSVLLADFCKVLGIPAAYASGWKADLTRWTVDDLDNSDTLHNFVGHGWTMIYFDGKWHMYDALWNNYDVTDPATMAKNGYYFNLIEGVAFVGEGVDPALCGRPGLNAAYYNGKIVTLNEGFICNDDEYYYVDQDGDVSSAGRSDLEWRTLWMEDRYYPSVCGNTSYDQWGQIISSSGYKYDDGRESPQNGYNFVNGWFNYAGIKYYADPDGILRNMDIETIDGTTYYFGETGEAVPIQIASGSYYLMDGCLYIKKGTKARLLNSMMVQELDSGEYRLEYNFIEATDLNRNPVDGQTMLKIDQNGFMTALKPGYVRVLLSTYRKSDGCNNANSDLWFFISDKDKPQYSFEDSLINQPGTGEGNYPSMGTVSKVKLSNTKYVYNGKIKTPSVTVYNNKGKVIDNKYYTVTRASGRKLVGTYKYTITGKNGYTGKKTVSFTIIPKTASIVSVTKGSRSFTVKWKKIYPQATGYQIRYSTKSSMAKSKTVTVKSYKKTSKKISDLKKKKKYYVQVRTYKTVSGKKYYSGWSSKKSVVTR